MCGCTIMPSYLDLLTEFPKEPCHEIDPGYGILPRYSTHGRVDTIMNIESSNIILYCKRWGETVSFYQSGLRLPITARNEWFVEFKLTDSSRLSVADESHTSIKSGSGKGITIGLQVADIAKTRAQFVAASLIPTEIKKIWGAKVFNIFDPEGNRIEFWSGHAKS